MKPTKEEFHAYLEVQYSGETNMFDAQAVQVLARDYNDEVELTRNKIGYIMQNYSTLKEEYGDINA